MLIRIYVVILMLMGITCGTAAVAKTRYVDSTHVSLITSSELAFSKIAQAIKMIEPGDVLIGKPGIFRESIRLIGNDNKPRRGLTIQGENTDSVIIKGLDVVAGWQKYRDDIFVKHDWLIEPQQVFVNGDSLQQVGGKIHQTRIYSLANFRTLSSLWAG